MDMTAEIVESLALGDHTSLSRPTLRGLVGLAVIASGVLRSSARVDIGDPEVVHVVASPVAHGSRLAEAVMGAMDGLRVARVADARLSSISVDVDIAGLGVRSVLSAAHRTAVANALRARRSAGSSAVKGISPSRLYSEYLFLAQHIRYTVAADALGGIAQHVLVLTDFDRAAYSRPWIWAANQRGLNTATMVHGSPNQNYIPVLADTALVWGEVQAEWFAKHSPGTVVEIVGRPDIADAASPETTVTPQSYITMEDIHRMVAD